MNQEQAPQVQQENSSQTNHPEVVKKKSKGRVVLVLLIGFIVGAVAMFGVLELTTKKAAAPVPQSTQQQQTPTSKTSEESDPTDGWQSYTNAYGGYTVRYPANWLRQTLNADLCTEGIVLLASSAERLGKCASDSGGEVMIGITKNQKEISNKLAKNEYPDLQETEITINGVKGIRLQGTYKAPVNNEVGIGPSDGDVAVQYIFLKNNNEYRASYSLPTGAANYISVFDMIITKAWTF